MLRRRGDTARAPRARDRVRRLRRDGRPRPPLRARAALHAAVTVLSHSQPANDVGARPRRAGGDPAAGVVAGGADGRPREQRPTVRRGEGRRPPSVVGVDRRDHDLPLVRSSGTRRQGGGETARVARPALAELPHRRPRRLVPHAPPGTRWAPGVPEPNEGPRRPRLLPRLRRARRRGAVVRGSDPPLRQRALRRAAPNVRRASSHSPATPSWTKAMCGKRSQTRLSKGSAT